MQVIRKEWCNEPLVWVVVAPPLHAAAVAAKGHTPPARCRAPAACFPPRACVPLAPRRCAGPPASSPLPRPTAAALTPPACPQPWGCRAGPSQRWARRRCAQRQATCRPRPQRSASQTAGRGGGAGGVQGVGGERGTGAGVHARVLRGQHRLAPGSRGVLCSPPGLQPACRSIPLSLPACRLRGCPRRGSPAPRSTPATHLDGSGGARAVPGRPAAAPGGKGLESGPLQVHHRLLDHRLVAAALCEAGGWGGEGGGRGSRLKGEGQHGAELASRASRAEPRRAAAAGRAGGKGPLMRQLAAAGAAAARSALLTAPRGAPGASWTAAGCRPRPTGWPAAAGLHSGAGWGRRGGIVNVY